ncbi:hypothetical protein U1Q18_025402 [Sarracenia purpurea var. burkii]
MHIQWSFCRFVLALDPLCSFILLLLIAHDSKSREDSGETATHSFSKSLKARDDASNDPLGSQGFIPEYLALLSLEISFVPLDFRPSDGARDIPSIPPYTLESLPLSRRVVHLTLGSYTYMKTPSRLASGCPSLGSFKNC